MASSLSLPNFQCRSCGSTHGAPVLDLGGQPLANNLLHPADLDKTEPRFPLNVVVCQACWLLQITEIVPPVTLFSEYLYFSSFSDTLMQHAAKAAARYRESFQLDANSAVVEIASNDGYLLRHFVGWNIPCTGIEPAANIARVAQEKGIPTINQFFTRALAEDLAAQGRQADLILGNNVFAHVPDTNDFVAGLQRLLKPGGRVVLEFPYAIDLIEHSEFDTIYHEHVYYFSLTALQSLVARHGLAVIAVERIPIHGGSLRLFLAHRERYPVDPSVAALLAEERALGVDTLAYYEGFSRRVEGLKADLLGLLRRLKQEGATIAAYGASAKGSTLLNYYGLGVETLDFVADRSTHKQGRLTPGTHLPIVDPRWLVERQPDYALLLTWNFAEEILRQQSEYRAKGGRFIVPIPHVRML